MINLLWTVIADRIDVGLYRLTHRFGMLFTLSAHERD